MTDTTRPHPRVERREVAGTRIPLEIGTLFLPAGLRPRPEVPILVHFHGAEWLVEYHARAAAPRTAVITVQLGAGSGIYARAFAEKGRFDRMLSEAAERTQGVLARDVSWSRVVVSSFSAGYGAVREILEDAGGYARIDGLLLLDSLHASYVPEGKPGPLEEERLGAFVRYARDASEGRKLFRLTHSEVFPGTFASTTETADHLLAQLGLRRRPVLKEGPIGMQQLSRSARGGFALYGFAGNSAPDHMDHLYALGHWLTELKSLLR